MEKKVTKKDKKTVSSTKKEPAKKAVVSEEKLVKKVDKKTPKKSTKDSMPKESKKTTKKATTKSVSKSPKKTSQKTTKKPDSSKTSSTKKTKSKTSSSQKQAKTKTDSTVKKMLAEYYDLPYRYNQTIVKILAQTPTTLFVYWDISDEDRNSLINTHGENFFNDTRPVLVVHNTTKNYSFEIDINDFANSWYIRTQEPNCDYVIELGRRFNRPSGEYIYIDASNDIVSPNDHILFENTDLRNILFKNIKTNKLSSKDFGDLKFINDMDKLYGNIYDVYSALYDDGILNELSNPSSGEFYLKK